MLRYYLGSDLSEKKKKKCAANVWGFVLFMDRKCRCAVHAIVLRYFSLYYVMLLHRTFHMYINDGTVMQSASAALPGPQPTTICASAGMMCSCMVPYA